MDKKEKSPEQVELERGKEEITEVQHKDSANIVASKTSEGEFSFYTSGIKSTVPRDNTMTVERLAKGIRTQFAKETAQIRQYLSMGDTAKADAIKKTLPYVTPSGTFTKRGNSGLIKYSGLLVLDIDDINDVDAAKKKILSQSDIDIILMFVSPSGHGLKVFVPSTTVEEHRQVFRMYQRYFAEQLGLKVDESGKDLARACFVCHDDDVYVSEKYEFRKLDKYWDDPQPQRPVNDLQRAGGAGSEGSNADNISKVYQFVAAIRERGIDVAPTYDDYLKLGFALATLGETGRQAFHDVCRLSPKYKYEDANEKFSECLKSGRGDITLATFFQMAKDAGIDIPRHDGKRRTRTKTQHTETLNYEIEGDDFLWYCFANNDETHGEVISSPARIAKFLEKEGFTRISEQGDDRIIIVRSDVKTLKPFNYETDTIAYLKNCSKHPDRKMDISNWLAKNLKNSNTVWRLLDGMPYAIQRDTKNAVHLFFKNGVARVTTNGVEMVDYASPEIRFYPQVESMNHTFTNTLQDPQDFNNRKAGDFEKFLNFAIVGSDKPTSEYTRDDLDKIRSFYSMVGYLLSNHKDMANSKAIILSDDGADDETRRGGRGKTLLTNGLRQLRSFLIRGGNEFDRGYRHVFADLEVWHDIYVIDDVPPSFDYDSLYTAVSGDILAERKGKAAVSISFRFAPKFVITTNWAVRFDKDAASTNRRFFEYKFSDFWNETNTPDKYFGRQFFVEWDSSEWQAFFEFMIFCVVVFLKFGLQGIKYQKTDDNFWVYFSNSLEEERFRVAFDAVKNKIELTTYEFTNEYKIACNGMRGKYFEKNILRPMMAYIERYNLGWKYTTRPTRKFVKVDNDDAINDKADDAGVLPF